MATPLPVKFGQLVDPAVADQFRRGGWEPPTCRWCSGPTKAAGAGFLCAGPSRCDGPEVHR